MTALQATGGVVVTDDATTKLWKQGQVTMAKELMKLTAAALTMLSTEAFAEITKNQVLSENTQQTQFTIPPATDRLSTRLVPEDLIVDLNGKTSTYIPSIPSGSVKEAEARSNGSCAGSTNTGHC
jgi:hypothetical protein